MNMYTKAPLPAQPGMADSGLVGHLATVCYTNAATGADAELAREMGNSDPAIAVRDAL
jgi:hypothetical protein